MRRRFTGPPTEPWILQNYRRYLSDFEPHNAETFEAVLETMTTELGSRWVASKAVRPAGLFRLYRSGNHRIGKVYLPNYDDQGATLEIELFGLPKLPERVRPSSEAVEAFLDELGSVNAFAEKARIMREDCFTHRRPNVPLSELDAASARRGLRALKHLI